MNNRLTNKAALIAVIAVLVAPAVVAGRGNSRDVYRAPRLDVMAYELSQATRHVRAEAFRGIRQHRAYRGPARIDGRVAGTLTQLDRQADQFRRAVNSRNDRRIDREFDRLVRAYDRASYEVARVRSPQLRADFQDVRFLMRNMVRRVEAVSRRAPRDREEARHESGSHGQIVFDDVFDSARVRVSW